MTLAEARGRYARGLAVKINGEVAASGGARAAADRLQNLLSAYKGSPNDGASPVRLKYRNGQAEADLPLGAAWCVRIDDKLIESLREWLSTESVETLTDESSRLSFISSVSVIMLSQ